MTEILLQKSGSKALESFLRTETGLDSITLCFLAFALECEEAGGCADINMMTAELGAVCHPEGHRRPRSFTGRFISLEGGDGSGKTTQTKLLAEALQKEGRNVVATRALGGASEAGARLRALILNPDYSWNSVAEGLLTIAVLRETLAGVIIPALEGGAWVVCDRLIDTFMVYLCDESAGLTPAIYLRWYDILVADIAPGLMPDITFLLDLPYEKAQERRDSRTEGRLDRNEAKGEAFHRSVFERYRAFAKTDPRLVVVDALLPEVKLTEAMAHIVKTHEEETGNA